MWRLHPQKCAAIFALSQDHSSTEFAMPDRMGGVLPVPIAGPSSRVNRVINTAGHARPADVSVNTDVG